VVKKKRKRKDCTPHYDYRE